MSSYCLKYKKIKINKNKQKTKSINPRVSKTKNNKTMMI